MHSARPCHGFQHSAWKFMQREFEASLHVFLASLAVQPHVEAVEVVLEASDGASDGAL